jgi:hypothetical protein
MDRASFIQKELVKEISHRRSFFGWERLNPTVLGVMINNHKKITVTSFTVSWKFSKIKFNMFQRGSNLIKLRTQKESKPLVVE